MEKNKKTGTKKCRFPLVCVSCVWEMVALTTARLKTQNQSKYKIAPDFFAKQVLQTQRTYIVLICCLFLILNVGSLLLLLLCQHFFSSKRTRLLCKYHIELHHDRIKTYKSSITVVFFRYFFVNIYITFSFTLHTFGLKFSMRLFNKVLRIRWFSFEGIEMTSFI